MVRVNRRWAEMYGEETSATHSPTDGRKCDQHSKEENNYFKPKPGAGMLQFELVPKSSFLQIAGLLLSKEHFGLIGAGGQVSAMLLSKVEDLGVMKDSVGSESDAKAPDDESASWVEMINSSKEAYIDSMVCSSSFRAASDCKKHVWGRFRHQHQISIVAWKGDRNPLASSSWGRGGDHQEDEESVDPPFGKLRTESSNLNLTNLSGRTSGNLQSLESSNQEQEAFISSVVVSTKVEGSEGRDSPLLEFVSELLFSLSIKISSEIFSPSKNASQLHGESFAAQNEEWICLLLQQRSAITLKPHLFCEKPLGKTS
ncbi:hypothetical protein HPP92_014921 [Vanilla planifolia]|uniref:Uncharacterized protein n=1 Tax=Vanilla planifolia TaxID=51239 RepID=A0A835QKY2_VANPL|nr:hypothetical protein HPP92_014921 [Vanilla planifolia]